MLASEYYDGKAHDKFAPRGDAFYRQILFTINIRGKKLSQPGHLKPLLTDKRLLRTYYTDKPVRSEISSVRTTSV